MATKKDASSESESALNNVLAQIQRNSMVKELL